MPEPSVALSPGRLRLKPARALRRILAGAGLLLVPVAAEFAFRALEPTFGIRRDRLERVRDFVLRNGASWYEAKPYYGWALAESLRKQPDYWFMGPEPAIERTEGVPRVLCLGGSTTASGNDLGFKGSFPYFLQTELSERLGTEVEVINGGVSGWTSAEMLCAWFLFFQDYKPDIVVIHEVVNDSEPRARAGFRRDYAHWRQSWSMPPTPAWLRWLIRRSDLCAWLRLQGRHPELRDATVLPAPLGEDTRPVPLVPETMEPYRRNLRSILTSVQSYGGTLLLATLPPKPIGATYSGIAHQSFREGIAQHNQLFRELGAEFDLIVADLEQTAEQLGAEQIDPWFNDLVHVRPEGNVWKARGIAEAIQDQLPHFEQVIEAVRQGQSAR